METAPGNNSKPMINRWKSNRCYTLLAGSIVFLLLPFSVRDQTIDIHVHDTYYVLLYSHLLLLPGLYLLLMWIVYALADRYLFSSALGWLHIIGTLICLAGITCLPWLLNRSPRFVDLSGSYALYRYTGYSRFMLGVRMLLDVFLALQALLALHLIIGLFRRLRAKPVIACA